MSMEGSPKRAVSGAEKEMLSRRGFLTGALAAGAASAVMTLDSKPAKAESAAEIHEGMKNVAELETANAHYRIVYSNHTVATNPAVIDGSDALALEVGIRPVTMDVQRQAQVELFHELYGNTVDVMPTFPGKPQYHDVLPHAFEQDMPVYFIDGTQVDPRAVEEPGLELPLSADEELSSRSVKGGIESLLGLAALSSGAGQLHKPTRRTLVPGIAKVLGGSWLLSSLPQALAERTAMSQATPEADEHSVPRRVEKTMESVNHTLHPELRTVVVDVRNALLAQKAETLGRWLTKKIGRKPIITLVIGGMHVGIERELSANESDRVEELKGAFGSTFSAQGQVTKVWREDGKTHTRAFTDEAFQ